jgi:hypothetical protein
VATAAEVLAQVATRVLAGCRRARGLADRFGERDEIVGARWRGSELSLVSDHCPAARGGQATSVLLAQVVRVGLGERGQRTDHRGRIGVDIGQRCDGLPGAAIAGATPW